jgi:cyclopropane fatty-acyl-phospholipid synthase-like methyltransferase
LYSDDLAYIHDVGFGDFAERAAPEVIRILHTGGIRPSTLRAPRIVEVGCGGGALARRLCDRGYDVVGFDVSPAMIRLARAKAPGAHFRVRSLTDARLPRCDAVVAIGEVITYVGADRAGAGLATSVRRFFARVHAALEPGGLFIFDFIESAQRRTYPATSRGGRDWALVSRADLDRSGRILTRRMVTIRKVGKHFRGSQETHRVRVHSRQDMAAALADAGFAARMSRAYGRYRLMAGDVAVVAEKL